MKRRGFIKSSAISIGLVSTPSFLLATAKLEDPETAQIAGTEPEEIRSVEYLRRAKSSRFLPKPPESTNISILPMPLPERLKRNIVPRRGFCCISPGGEGLSAGNGAVNIEVIGNP